MWEKFECKKCYHASYLKYGKREAVRVNFTDFWSNICSLQVIVSYEFVSQSTQSDRITLRLASEILNKYRLNQMRK